VSETSFASKTLSISVTILFITAIIFRVVCFSRAHGQQFQNNDHQDELPDLEQGVLAGGSAPEAEVVAGARRCGEAIHVNDGELAIVQRIDNENLEILPVATVKVIGVKLPLSTGRFFISGHL
jgi:preprotein translocase subunit YajC